ncbi:MAG: hypothetical protein WKG01_00500 [Kofleriaceae bacterium]
MPIRVDEQVEAVALEARLHAIATGTLRPNRALADQLVATHRSIHELDVLDQDLERALSPEEKLLLAIFGETARSQLPELGRTVVRGGELVRHLHGVLHFSSAPEGVIEAVESITTGLPAGIGERIRVTVRWSGPLEVGDSLFADDARLGLVDEIVDDGDPVPRLHVASRAGQACLITRGFPTASQELHARGVGAYDPVTHEPVDGEPLRLDQLSWLVAAGGLALVSEHAAYKTGGDSILAGTCVESQIKHEPIADGWSACTHRRARDRSSPRTTTRCRA